MANKTILAFTDSLYLLEGNALIEKPEYQDTESYQLNDRLPPTVITQLNNTLFLAGTGSIWEPGNRNRQNLNPVDASPLSIHSNANLIVLLQFSPQLQNSKAVVFNPKLEIVSEVDMPTETRDVRLKDRSTINYITQNILFELDINSKHTKEIQRNCTTYAWIPNKGLAFSQGKTLTIQIEGRKQTIYLQTPLKQLYWANKSLIMIDEKRVGVWNPQSKDSANSKFRLIGRIACGVALIFFCLFHTFWIANKIQMFIETACICIITRSISGSQVKEIFKVDSKKDIISSSTLNDTQTKLGICVNISDKTKILKIIQLKQLKTFSRNPY